MQIGIPKERLKNEARVATTPQTVTQLLKLGFTVAVEEDAGQLASFDDASYIAAGATIETMTLLWESDIILKVNPPTEAEVKRMKSGATLISFIQPAQNEALVNLLIEKQINTIAIDRIPRISRAQSMDALSSMANIAGYRAIVEASYAFGRFFTGQITAAGKVPPANVLVLGAGVAGLAAIGAAGSMGAQIKAFDVRPEVKEQIQSMGAQFVELKFQEEAVSSDGYAK
ncbi:MAG: Re/Si-specific NAD(P)(+) transhydrogenase subunit alpha, partial [Saezia sp.]